MIELDAPSVLLQWATGGLAFGWVTGRHRLLGIGYGWLLRSSFGLLGLVGFLLAVKFEFVASRDIPALGLVIATFGVLALSVFKKPELTDPRLDMIAPAFGFVGVIAAAVAAGGPLWLALGRMLIGTLFMGVLTDAMLLGHWYLVQPGLSRKPLLELVRWTGALWVPETLLLLIPVGMLSVWTGTIDDAYGGMLGWFWGACVVTTLGLVIATLAALKEKQYEAVMAATGLAYLNIMTGFGIDLVARALLR